MLRAKRLDKDGAVRFRAYGEVVTATVAPIYGNSLLGSDPTILGMRILKLEEASDLDFVASIGAILDRLATRSTILEMPATREVISWAGVSAPQQGWVRSGDIPVDEVKLIAEAGIAEVAQAVPGNLGASLVSKVRADVWGRKFGDFQLPSGVCFVLSGLGFLVSGEAVAIYSNGNWRRLSTPYGHVLTRVG